MRLENFCPNFGVSLVGWMCNGCEYLNNEGNCNFSQSEKEEIYKLVERLQVGL